MSPLCARRLRRLLWAVPLAGAGLARVAVADPAPFQLPATSTSSAWSTPGLELLYTLEPGPAGKAALARLQGVVDAGGSRLRTDVRIDPNGEPRRMAAMDLSWELSAAGPLRNVVVGDSYATGAGWSQPSRMTGVRFGRSVTVRAPLRADGSIPVATPGFAAAARGLNESGESALLDAKRLLPGAARTAMAAPTPSDPTALQAGATDYDIELGRLRDGWNTPDRTYLAQYGAAGYRAGLGRGLTAEARTEWTSAQSARGVELLQELGAGVSVQAVAAQSSGADLTGRRWGMAIVRKGDGMAWRVAYAAADREYRLVTGAMEAREGVRVGTSVAVGRRATAEVSYLRTSAWDAAPESTMLLATHVELPRRARLSLDLAVGTNAQTSRRAGVSLSLPLDTLLGR